MVKPATRIKAAAATYAVQTRDECAAAIRSLGDTSREITRLTAAMNDEIAAITERYQAQIDPLKARGETLSAGIQTWCEAHRAELLPSGKTANLITGEVAWRVRPPSVAIRGVESVIETLKRLGLGRFVRTKEEVNKEAILNEPAAVAGVAGINVVSGVEDFVITPFEQVAG